MTFLHQEVVSPCDHFFEFFQTNGTRNGMKKATFTDRHLVIIVVFGCYYYCLFNLQVLYVFVLEPKPFNLTKPRPRSVPMPEKVSTRQLSIKALIKELHFNLYLFRGGW